MWFSVSGFGSVKTASLRAAFSSFGDIAFRV